MLTHRRLAATRLRERLDAACAPTMQSRARDIGAKIAAENGVANGVVQIEAWMRAAAAATTP